ncbi:MAG: D-glycero-beta-D-manno-heptose 1-phosphate adenylyltransferase [Dissulfurispiraceae bacterium]
MMGTILSRENLKEELARLKEQGKQIVFTNGCFDIIHIGHIRYLRAAKALGDVLVIGLNSDVSVGRLKPGRPVTPEDQRVEVLSALVMVDYVTVFDEDTPYDLINLLKPDVLVKGGDWKKEDIVGADLVAEVHSLPFTCGISTTNIIRKIRALEV